MIKFKYYKILIIFKDKPHITSNKIFKCVGNITIKKNYDKVLKIINNFMTDGATVFDNVEDKIVGVTYYPPNIIDSIKFVEVEKNESI